MIRKNKNYFIKLILILILLSSCKSESPTDSLPNSSNGLIPLKIGNVWNFRISQYNSNGSIIGTSQGSYSVSRDTIINNERWFLISSHSWGLNKSDGVWVQTGSNAPILAYKYPAAINDVCHAAYYLDTKVISINGNIVVPAGNFLCYKYQSNRNDFADHRLEMIEWYSPNIGPIRIEYYGLGYLSQVSELTSYTIK